MLQSYIVLNERDNVAVALKEYVQGETVKCGNQMITLQSNIPFGHKFAIKEIAQGQNIIKYGYAIGHATTNINLGEHVHVHNLKTNLSGEVDFSYDSLCADQVVNQISVQVHSKLANKTFLGYVRNNGEVGIRNDLWIIPTVFCVNNIARELEGYAREFVKANNLNNIDNCFALTHPYGCSQMGEDQKNTMRLLASLSAHPNCGAVLVLGLGCENNNINVFKEYLNLQNNGTEQYPSINFLNCQDVEDEVTEGYTLVENLLKQINQYQRTEVPLSKLCIGLKCGGSDALSGISANPLIGKVTNVLVQAQGSAVMTEVPEMFGAESILLKRCKDEQTFNKLLSMINSFKQYFISHGQVVSENPSPGNKAGGISSLEDKSLGCVQKGGHAVINDVIEYAHRKQTQGLNVLKAPGNDGISTTALVASGCHLVLFSTGRGTPFGSVVPTIKISTNSNLYKRKSNWIDFNAGQLLDGKSLDELSDELIDKIIAIASGKEKTKSETLHYHEIVIWKDGVSL